MTQNRSTVLLLLLAALLAGCGKSLPENPLFDNTLLASPCQLFSDTQQVILRDFFPLLPSEDTIVIAADSSTPALYVMEIESGEQRASLLVENCLPEVKEKLDRSRVPYITTMAVSSRSFEVKIDGPVKQLAVLWQNTLLGPSFVKQYPGGKVVVKVPSNARKMERSYIRVYGCNEYGVGNDILVPLKRGKIIRKSSQLDRSDKHAQILYSLMIDRFSNGDTLNDRRIGSPEVLPKVDYYGGDFKGVTDKIKEGFFDSLGVTTVWLSPITQNPYDAWGYIPEPETKFSGYHGYWPIYVTKVEERFGGEEALRELIDEAHADNKNIILDYVANHMHINSPFLTEHPDWVTPSMTPDGRKNRELWDEFRLTTWFDDHIPSLDLEKEYVYEPLTDSALFWVTNYPFDGFRHDACKHIPEVYWRTLTRKLLENVKDRSLYQIGETYGSLELISSYVKPGMLDAQFDFNVSDKVAGALMGNGFAEAKETIRASLETYGSHHLMGNVTGNHDRPRITSLLGGGISYSEDTKLAGWMRDVTVGDSTAYAKLKLLHAAIMTLPGVPCVYYGDEYGQPGANDPDNRRWMKFDNYTPEESDVLDNFKHLTSLRRSSMALIYGDFRFIEAENDDILAYVRSYMGENVAVAINCGKEAASVSINGEEMTVEPLSYIVIQY